MAISLLENRQDDEKDKENNPLPTLGGDRSANFSTGLGANNASGSVGASTRFTNLKKYLDANKQGAANTAERMGRAVSDDFSNYQKDFGAKTEEVNQGISKAQEAFAQGGQFKNTLGSITNDFNTFQSMDDRDKFNQGGQSLFDFNRDYGQKFNELRTGMGLNEAQLQQAQGMNQAMNDAYLAQAQRNQQGIQNEQGRYEILKKAQPKFGGYSSGQGRLDQLLFQGTPSAVNSLQNTFNQNLDKVRQNVGVLSGINTNLNSAIEQEKALQGELSTAANTAQNTFLNKMNQQKNFDLINNQRNALYNEYLSQIQNKTISKDLANVLGVSGLGGFGYDTGDVENRYTPVDVDLGGNAGKISRPLNPDGTITEMYRFAPNDRQFTGFNKNLADYIQQGNQVTKLQDIFTQKDYDVYSALSNLSGQAPIFSGPSQLGASVLSKGNLANDLATSLGNFQNQYGNRTFEALGAGVGSTANAGSREAAEAILAGPGQAVVNDITTNPSGYDQYLSNLINAGQGSDVSIAANRNILSTNRILNNLGPDSRYSDYRDLGNTASDTMAGARADAAANTNAAAQNLINQILNTGVKDLYGLTDIDASQKYKRYGGLV